MNDSGHALILPQEGLASTKADIIARGVGPGGGFWDMDMCSAIADRRQGW
jgi:hypothetical protein